MWKGSIGVSRRSPGNEFPGYELRRINPAFSPIYRAQFNSLTIYRRVNAAPP
jgi:hypothetical protein